MPPEDEVRIRHMVTAVTTALRFVAGRDRSALDKDEMLTLALTKLVEIICEAAKQVTSETREQLPAVPWSAAARMRDPWSTTTSTSISTSCGPPSNQICPAC